MNYVATCGWAIHLEHANMLVLSKLMSDDVKFQVPGPLQSILVID